MTVLQHLRTRSSVHIPVINLEASKTQNREDVMKTYTMVAASLLIASATALGQDAQRGASRFASITSHSEEYVQNAAENYTLLLTSQNDGVVESATAHLTYLRMGSPGSDFSEARKAITKLADNGRTNVIRYKARLAMVVFDSPELFADGVRASSSDGNEFFLEIASKVQKTLLGQNM